MALSAEQKKIALCVTVYLTVGVVICASRKRLSSAQAPSEILLWPLLAGAALYAK